MVRNAPCEELGSPCSIGRALVDFAILIAKGGKVAVALEGSGRFRNPCCEILKRFATPDAKFSYACSQIILLPSFATPVAKLRNVLANIIFGCELMVMTPF